MAESLVITLMRDFREALLAREATQMQQMARRWLVVEDALAAQIDGLARDLAAEKAAGKSASQANLFRMQRYQALMAQLRTEVQQYEGYAERTIRAEQQRYVQLGLDQADAALRAAAPSLSTAFDRLSIEAVEVMAGLAAQGSPLAGLLAQSWPDAAAGLSNALVRGTAMGWHPTKTAQEMRRGMAQGLNRALVIARDQQLRAYRYAGDERYRRSGVVTGKRRLAAHDGRTCLACLSRDGEFIPLDEPAYDHTQGRCTFVPSVDGMPALQWQKGQAWFNGLPAAEQRTMMGDRRYQAYKDGEFAFADLATDTQNATWGRGLAVTPLSALGLGKQEAA